MAIILYRYQKKSTKEQRARAISYMKENMKQSNNIFPYGRLTHQTKSNSFEGTTQWRNAMRAFGAQAPPVFLKKENSIIFNE